MQKTLGINQIYLFDQMKYIIQKYQIFKTKDKNLQSVPKKADNYQI